MSVGLDTSVIVRLLVGAPEKQAEAARRRLEAAIEAGELVIVSDFVLAEAYRALQYHYRVPKAEALAMLRRFVASGIVTLEPAAARAALYARGGAGLVDRLIHARNRSLAVTTLTFDRRLARLEGAVLLRPV